MGMILNWSYLIFCDGSDLFILAIFSLSEIVISCRIPTMGLCSKDKN